MVERRRLLLESVKKLLALNVSEREIILNLKDVGVGEQEALELLDEARGKAPRKAVTVQKQQEPIGEEESPEAALEEEAEEETDEIPEEIPTKEKAEETAPEEEEEFIIPEESAESEEHISEAFAEEMEQRKKKKAEAAKKRAVESALEKHELTETHGDLSKLWEKGILSAANASLQEMKRIRAELDKVIDEKVQKETEKELKKIKALQESQQLLIMHKMNDELQKKADEVNGLIDEKIKFLAKSNKEIQSQIEKLEAKKQVEKSLFEQLSARLSDLKKAKDATVSEFNSELIKARSAVQETIDEAEKKIEEVDMRVNKTLELQSAIAEGLLREAKAKVDQLSLEKSKELENKFKREIMEINTLKAQIRPEEIKAMLGEVSESKKEMERAAQEQAKEMQRVSGKRFEQMEKEFQEQIDNLDAFKQQFIKIIEANVGRFNKEARRLNETLAKFEEQQNARMKAIDAKIEELDEFEKNFAKEMGIALEKLEIPETKKKK